MMRRSRQVPIQVESLEQRCLLSATVIRQGDTGYFLDKVASQVERFDIAHEAWLSPINLVGSTGTPSVLHVDDDGIYVAYGKAAYRYNADGSGRTHLLNAPNNVLAIHSDGNLLFLNQASGLYARLISINKNSNTVIDTFENYVDSVYGSSISRETNRIFGRSDGIYPSDITYVAYNDAGEFTFGGASPYHGDYPDASTTWVFPTGAKVVDDSGTMYSADNLTRLNSFGSSITDIDFLGTDIPIVLSGNQLTAYSAAILPTGSVTLSDFPLEIFVNSQNVITFSGDGTSSTGYRTRIVSLADLDAPTPGEPINPVGLAYTPDKIEVATDGSVLLFSKSFQSIFRWDPVSQTYGATIPLIGVPEFMAYSSVTNTVYLAYASGLIRKIDLGAATLTETPFATLPNTPIGLATAGQYLFAADPSGAWGTHYTFAPDGTLISAVDWNYYSTEYVWSEANQKMYFFRDDTSPNDLLFEEINANGVTYPELPPGGIGNSQDSPLHGEVDFFHPIRVSPNGSVVVTGAGVIFNARTLELQTLSLANEIADAAWLNDRLYSIRTVLGFAQFQQWVGPTYSSGKVTQTSGVARALIATSSDRLLGITVDEATGIPLFWVMDADLNVLSGEVPNSTTFSIASADSSNLEGGDGLTSFTFTVSRSGNTSGSMTVEFAVSGAGDFEADEDDFGGSLPTGTLQFATGETSKTLTINISGDEEFERDEGFAVTLVNPSGGATLATDSATGTIQNDDLLDAFFSATGSAVLKASVVNGRLQVRISNVSDTQLAGVPPAAIRSLTILGARGADSINLAGLSRSLYPRLTQIILDGGLGNDSITGSADFDELITGGLGNDVLNGGSGRNDRLFERADSSSVSITLTNSRLTGFGQDTISNFEAAVLIGSQTSDRLNASGFSGRVTLVGGQGNDTLTGGTNRSLLDGGDGNDQLQALSSSSNAATLLGGSGNDNLIGAKGADVLLGGDGNDRLTGGTGNDRLSGEAGNDSLKGGAGNDLLIGGFGVDTVDGESGNDVGLGGQGGPARGGNSRKEIGDSFKNLELVDESFAVVFDWE